LSFGARVALEVAQQLTRSGHEVGVLALLDAGPGGAGDLLPFADRALETAGRLKRRIEGHLHELRNETDWAAYASRKLKTTRRKLRSRAWRSEYRKYAASGESLPAELANVKEANYLAARAYIPKPYPGRITLFIAADRTQPEAAALRDAWTTMALGGLDVHVVPGNHVTIIEQPNVSTLAAELQACLDAYGTIALP
jgi:aspartate racemase